MKNTHTHKTQTLHQRVEIEPISHIYHTTTQVIHKVEGMPNVHYNQVPEINANNSHQWFKKIKSIVETKDKKNLRLK